MMLGIYLPGELILDRLLNYWQICGLYYEHIIIVNDNSSIVNK